MALVSRTREVASPPLEVTDEVVRTCIVWHKQTATCAIHVTWEVALPNGRTATREGIVTSETLALIVDESFQAKLLLAADDTHPQVTP